VVERLGCQLASGGIAVIASSLRYAPAYSHQHIIAPAGECDNGATGTVKPSFAQITCVFAPVSARAPQSNRGTFAPVLADARQAVAFRGPQPRERITSSILAPGDDCGNVDKAVALSASRPGDVFGRSAVIPTSSLLPGWRPWDAPEMPGDRGKRRPFCERAVATPHPGDAVPSGPAAP